MFFAIFTFLTFSVKLRKTDSRSFSVVSSKTMHRPCYLKTCVVRRYWPDVSVQTVATHLRFPVSRCTYSRHPRFPPSPGFATKEKGDVVCIHELSPNAITLLKYIIEKQLVWLQSKIFNVSPISIVLNFFFSDLIIVSRFKIWSRVISITDLMSAQYRKRRFLSVWFTLQPPLWWCVTT